MRKVRLSIEVELPENVKINRLQNALFKAVKDHVVPVYSTATPWIVVALVSDDKGGAS